MIIGIGTDVVQIRRIQITIDRFGTKFLNRIFTAKERERGETLSGATRYGYYAKRYAAKEAVSKALGTGIGRLAGWQEIEILNNETGAPTVHLSGQSADTLTQKANGQETRMHLSLSDDLFAAAFVVIETL